MKHRETHTKGACFRMLLKYFEVIEDELNNEEFNTRHKDFRPSVLDSETGWAGELWSKTFPH